MQTIVTIISFLKKHKKLVGFLLFAILIFFNYVQFNQVRSLKNENKIAYHNLAVANDSIRIGKTKAGEFEYERLAYISTINDLKKVNKELDEEVKKTIGKVKTIIKTNTQIVTKEIPVKTDTKIEDSTVIVDFAIDTTYSPGNFLVINGFTSTDLVHKLSVAKIKEHKIGIDLVVGIRDIDKGKPEIFVRSLHPGFEVTKLSGAVLDNNLFLKPKSRVPLITIGGTIGWTPMTYDFGDKKFEVKPMRMGATVGLNVNLVELFKR